MAPKARLGRIRNRRTGVPTIQVDARDVERARTGAQDTPAVVDDVPKGWRRLVEGAQAVDVDVQAQFADDGSDRVRVAATVPWDPQRSFVTDWQDDLGAASDQARRMLGRRTQARRIAKGR